MSVLSKPYFHDEAAAYTFLEGLIWANGPTCPHCGNAACEVTTFHTVTGDEPYANRPLAALGVPAFDIVTARTADAAIGYELTGDAANVLGPCFDEGLEWT